jgi:hypothetical protein
VAAPLSLFVGFSLATEYLTGRAWQVFLAARHEIRRGTLPALQSVSWLAPSAVAYSDGMLSKVTGRDYFDVSAIIRRNAAATERYGSRL